MKNLNILTARRSVLVGDQILPLPPCPLSPWGGPWDPLNPGDSCTSWKTTTCWDRSSLDGLINKQNGDIALSCLALSLHVYKVSRMDLLNSAIVIRTSKVSLRISMSASPPSVEIRLEWGLGIFFFLIGCLTLICRQHENVEEDDLWGLLSTKFHE